MATAPAHLKRIVSKIARQFSGNVVRNRQVLEMPPKPRIITRIARYVPVPFLETAVLLLLAVIASYFA